MNDITSYSGLNPANLDRSDYMNTLAAEALRVGLIKESDIDRIRSDLMTALAEVIGYYTKNDPLPLWLTPQTSCRNQWCIISTHICSR